MSDLTSHSGDVGGDSPGCHISRILFVSANMGAGHNATARAVEQAARRLWPHVRTRWVDTLGVMGPGVGPAFRQIYVTNVQSTPWLYEFFYESLWRHRWFASASKRFVGAWCGPRLASIVEDYAPDLIVSTYPLGSAGLQWLRTQRGLDAPVAAWVSDFSPHPFWVYPDLDVHFVMHDACVPPAVTAEPEAAVRVAALPVGDAFQPGDRGQARRKLDLDLGAFVVVLSCGYFGFGTVVRAVDTLLDADPRVHIVAVCGRNEQLRRRLLTRTVPPERLSVLGWVDDMSTYMAAADIVLTNAGGATSLEALACGRSVVMFEPIAAHGRANAELMAAAGLALLCRTPEHLREAIQRLLDHPGLLAELERAALGHAESRTREEDLRVATSGRPLQAAASGQPASSGRVAIGRPLAGRTAASSRVPRLRPLQAEDAFFLYADTPHVNQILGGVVHLEARVDLETLLAEVGRRLGGLPNLRRRLVTGRSGWRRPAWLFEDSVDLRDHVRERVLGTEGEPATLRELIDDFFSTPLDLRRQPWELHLVQGLEGERSGILVKLHHVLGDGFAAIDSMAGLLDEMSGGNVGEGHAAGGEPEARERRDTAASGAAPSEKASPHGPAQLVRWRVQRVVSGVWNLARAGHAPSSELNGPMAGGRRRHAFVSLPVDDVRAAARGLHSSTNAVLIAVIAHALDRLLDGRGEQGEQGEQGKQGERGERGTYTSLRVMVPRTIRTPDTRHALGNITAAVPVDLPMGPLTAPARLAEVETRMRRSLDSGGPEASRFLIKAMGALPPPVHARVARAAYSGRWFNAIVSIIPGPRRPQSFAGVKLTDVHPVLPLAEGVGLSIGLMRWADTFQIGLTGDAGLMPHMEELAEVIRTAFAEFRRAARDDRA